MFIHMSEKTQNMLHSLLERGGEKGKHTYV